MTPSETRRAGRASGPIVQPAASLPGSPAVRAALLLLLAVVAFHQAIEAGVVWDDCELVATNAAIRSLARPWRFFTDNLTQTPYGGLMVAAYRPLRTLGYAVQYAVFGGNAWGFHLVSLLLHGLGAAGVGLLARRLFGRGWLAAALWLLHPVLAETALSLASQANLLCVLGVTGALLAHLRWLDSGVRGWQAVSLLAGAGAMLAYEFGVVVPLLVGVVELAYRHRGGTLRSTWAARYLPWAALTVGYLALRAAVVLPAGPVAPWGGSRLASLAMQLQLWTEGWRLAVAPFGMLPRYVPEDTAAVPLAVAIAFHLALAGFVVWAMRRRRATVAALAVAAFYVAQAPSSNFLVPIPGYPFAPRYLFLSLLVPLAAFGAWAEARLVARPRLLPLALAVLAVGVVLDWRQVAIWRSPFTYFRAILSADPGDFAARANLAASHLLTGDLDAAEREAGAAQKAQPEEALPYSLEGDVRRLQGRLAEADTAYRNALQRHRMFVPALIGFARIQLAQGNAAYVRRGLGEIEEADGITAENRAQIVALLADADSRLATCAAVPHRVARAAALAPGSVEALLDGSRALSRCGERAAAHDVARRAADAAARELRDMVGDLGW